MSIERCCNLHIFVYNYEKFQEESYVPIHNADITIYQNSSEILEESITNGKGEVNYIVNKGEDFLTVVVSKLGYYPVQRVFIRNKEAQINESGEYEENLTFFLVKESFILENNCILCVTYSSLVDVNFDPNAIQISDNIKNRLNLSCYDGQKENGVISTFIKYQTKEEMAHKNNMNYNNQDNEEEQNNNDNNSKENENHENDEINHDNNVNELNNNENNEITSSTKNNDESETDNFDNIVSISFIIQTEALKNHNYQDKGFTMNGLERYGCQTIIYTPKNMFYITAPAYCNEGYCLWNIGWIDAQNQLFYQTNTLSESLNERIMHFNCWLEFLQALIDNRIYLKIFEFFGFDRAILLNNDRYINESTFIQYLKLLNFCKENEDEIFPFITSLFKTNNKMISFSLVKKKICSNLKNFSDESIGGKNYIQNNNNNQEITSSENKNNSNSNNEDYEENYN